MGTQRDAWVSAVGNGESPYETRGDEEGTASDEVEGTHYL